MYKLYADIIEYERKQGLYQPKNDRELLVPAKPLAGIYNGHIWDVIEAGDKAIIRLDLERGIFFDWEIWAKEWKSERPSWQLISLLQYFRAASPKQLIGKQFKGARIDQKHNVTFA